jgi:hypothetical protein
MLAYEELKGSTGREVWYRPPRYEARKLFPTSRPRVRVRQNVFHLHDISLSGIAAVSHQTQDDGLHVGETVAVTLQQAGLPIFESRARVMRKEPTMFGAKVAFNFVDGFVEFDKLLNRNAQAQLARTASLFNEDSSQLVPREYRAFTADVLRHLRSYRAVLEQNVAITEGFEREFDSDSAYAACEEQLVNHWRALWRTGNDIVRQIAEDRAVFAAMKEYTELVLTPELRLGAIWDRSYAKPLGYPGDFGVMNQVYDWERTGSTVYGMLMHRIGLEVAECIKTRMEVVRSIINRIVREKGQDRPARIMSLGCGPAREVELFLSSPHVKSGRAEFTLIDQESQALQYAYEHTYPHALKTEGRARVRCVNISFTDILRGTGALGSLPPQDLVYSVGLLDYLVDRRAGGLTQRLYDTLAPGGLLIIGNMNDVPLSNLWPMEFIADWTLHYRSDADMLGWVKGLNTSAAWTETEPTERVRLLFATRG